MCRAVEFLVRESEERDFGRWGERERGGYKYRRESGYTERLLRGTDVRTWQVQLLFGVGAY